MLQLYDLNKVKIQGLKEYKDLNIESILSTGDKRLSFLYPSNLSKNIKEEGYIRTKTDEFVIKEITDNKEWKSIKATLNIESLEGQPWEHFDTTEKTIVECLTLALAGTGWTVQANNVTKKRTVRKTNCSTWDIIQQAKKTYLAEMEFDTINKKINIAEKLGSDKGVYFIDSLNLKDLDIQSNSYDFYTRIIAIGKDDLKVTVENYQYSNKKKTLIWKDERYTVLESLREDATAKLEELSKPYKAYKADIIDLASINDKYGIIAYGLGDTITLISKYKSIKEKQRIVKITEFPEEPERNTCEIANTLLRFEDIQKEQQDTTDTVNNITTDNGTVDGSAINSIKTEQISDFEVNVGKITNLTAINIRVDNLYAKKADIDSLNAVSARIGTVEITMATITDLKAQTIRVDNLFVDKAEIKDLKATNGKITLLETKVGSIDTILSKEIFAELISAGKIVAGSSIIAEGAIGSAQINSLDVNKLNAGDISTSKIRIISADGSIQIFGNQLLVNKDGKNRVVVGEYKKADGSTDYGLLVRSKDGTTIMLDGYGVHNAGLTSDSIKDNVVADNANISGNKLDINSVIRAVNTKGTETIAGTKVTVGDRTLDVELSTQKNLIDSANKELSTQKATVSAMDQAIKLKVDNQTFTQYKNTTDGNISNINTSLNKNTTSIDVLQKSIALKVEQTQIDKATTDSKAYTDGQVKIADTKINTKVAEININLDSIGTRIGKTESVTSTVDGKVTALSTRVSNAETKLTDSSIISTVRNSTAYKTDLGSKASTTDLTNAQSSISQLSNKIDSNVSETSTIKGVVTSHTSSITQLGAAISQKVSTGEFSSKFSQAAANFEFSIGQTGKNTIYIDKNGLIIRHGVGDSWTHASADGLYHYDAAGNRGYHYLSYQSFIIIPAGGKYIRINLPKDFKGKDFKVMPNISTITNVSADWAIKNWDTGYDNVDKASASFTIIGFLQVQHRLTGEVRYIDTGVTYIVTA